MYERWGRLIAGRWPVVLAVWVGLVVAINAVAPRWDDVTRDGDLAYLPSRMTSVRGERLMGQAFDGPQARSQVVLAFERTDRPLDAVDFAAIERLAEAFEAETEAAGPLPIANVWSPAEDVLGEKLVSGDRRAALVLLQLSHEFLAVKNIEVLGQVRARLDEARASGQLPRGLGVGVTGSAAIGGDMLLAAAESIRSTEWLSAALVIAILLVVYRAPLLALVPLVVIFVSVAVATDLIALAARAGQEPHAWGFQFQIFKTTRIFLITLLFGSGTDFCLFLIARYREELEAGSSPVAALARSLAGVGDALVASALTTVVGLGVMAFADFGKFRNSGPALGVAILVALSASLSLAPALLRLLGPRVFWPWGLRTATDGAARGGGSLATRLWDAVARYVVRRPGWVGCAAVLALAPLAWQGWQVEVTYNLLGELDADRPSVVGTDLLRRHFPAGETGPITILAHKPGADFGSREGRQDIARLTAVLSKLPGVTSVRSLAEPLGGTPGVVNPFNPASRSKLLALRSPRVEAMFLGGDTAGTRDVTRLDVIVEHDPFSLAAAEVLEQIETQLAQFSADAAPGTRWHQVEFDFLGTTAATRDLRAVTQSDRTLIERLVSLAVFSVLLVMLRRPLVCGLLVAAVVLTYFATLGATELAFSLGNPRWEGLDWKVPTFLFVILVAVGADYSVYLTTRVLQEQRARGRLAGLRHAIVQTGGIISSCGLIMAGTFVAMTASSLAGMRQLGFALTLGILLDTFLVRPVLVPALLVLQASWEARRLEATAGRAPGEAADSLAGS